MLPPPGRAGRRIARVTRRREATRCLRRQRGTLGSACPAKRTAQRQGERGAGLIARGGVLRHAPRQDPVDSGRQLRPDGGQRRHRRIDVREEPRQRVAVAERHGAREQAERDAGQGVLVGAPIDRAAGYLLWCAVVGGAQEPAGGGQPGRARGSGLGKAEVRQVGVLGASGDPLDEDIARLDITVHQPDGVRGVERAGADLGNEIGRKNWAERGPLRGALQAACCPRLPRTWSRCRAAPRPLPPRTPARCATRRPRRPPATHAGTGP